LGKSGGCGPLDSPYNISCEDQGEGLEVDEVPDVSGDVSVKSVTPDHEASDLVFDKVTQSLRLRAGGTKLRTETAEPSKWLELTCERASAVKVKTIRMWR